VIRCFWIYTAPWRDSQSPILQQLKDIPWSSCMWNVAGIVGQMLMANPRARVALPEVEGPALSLAEFSRHKERCGYD